MVIKINQTYQVNYININVTETYKIVKNTNKSNEFETLYKYKVIAKENNNQIEGVFFFYTLKQARQFLNKMGVN